MGTSDEYRHHRAPIVAGVGLGILGAAIGLFGAIFGPYCPLVVGAVLAVTGLALRRRYPGAGMLALALGLGLIAGSLLYVVLGLLQQGAPGSGGGGSTSR